jgi:hypothetical protein
MGNKVEFVYTDGEFKVYIVYSLKWWRRALNFFYPFFKTFTIIDNLEANDIVIVDQEGYNVKKKSLTFTPEPGTYEIEVEELTSGSISGSNNIVKQYCSTTVNTSTD